MRRLTRSFFKLLKKDSATALSQQSRKIACTQSIVHIMSKTLEISRPSNPRSHRTYSAQFKAELIAACQQPGVSIAALARPRVMNANVLHGWLKEHQHSGCHRLVARSHGSALEMTSSNPGFVPVQLPVTLQPQAQ